MKNKLKESENKLKEKNDLKIKENKIKMDEELKLKNGEYLSNKQNKKDNYDIEINEIRNKYKAIDDINKNIYEKELSKLNDKYKRKIKRYNYDESIENLDNIKRLNEIIYNAYKIHNNNYYNSLNINNILISILNNKTYINDDDLYNEYENIIKIKNGTINNKKGDNQNKIKYNKNFNLDNIISFDVFKNIFSCFSEKKKLEIIHYNKRIQNNLNINLNNYKNFTGNYLKYETIVKKYNNDGKLLFEGEYINGKISGKGKEYDSDGKLIFEGEYLNGKRHGNGKEYSNGDWDKARIRIHNIIVKYIERKDKNRMNYLKKKKLLQWEENAKKSTEEAAMNRIAKWAENRYNLANARNKWRDLADKYDMFITKSNLFQLKQRLINWLKLRNMKQVEKLKQRDYKFDKPMGVLGIKLLADNINTLTEVSQNKNILSKLVFEGEYLNGKRNGKGKEYDNNGKLIYEGEYLNGKRHGKGKEYDYNTNLIYEVEYLKGKRIGKGKEYYIDNQIYEGQYLNEKNNPTKK